MDSRASVSYRPRIVAPAVCATSSSSSLLHASHAGRRGAPGQRAALETRPVFIRCGVVSQAAGSAYLEQGKTKVICSVFGPQNRQQGRSEYRNKGTLLCDVRFAPFAREGAARSDNRQSADEKHLSQMLRRALVASVQVNRFPKSVLEIHVLVLQDDGAALAAAISCASLALADSGVDLYDLVAGCSVVVMNGDETANINNGKDNHEKKKNNKKAAGTAQHDSPATDLALAVDPSLEEERHALATVVVARMPTLDKVTELSVTGSVAFDLMGSTLSTALLACSAVGELMREQLRKSVQDGAN